MYRAMNIFTGVVIEAESRKTLDRAIHWETINFSDNAKGWIYRKNWTTSKTFKKYWRKAGLV